MLDYPEGAPEPVAMTIGLMRIELFISDANNLKDKRGVMRSVMDNLRRKFNVSVIEGGDTKWQRGVLEIANISSDRAKCNSTLNKIIEFIKSDPRVEIIEYSIELL